MAKTPWRERLGLAQPASSDEKTPSLRESIQALGTLPKFFRQVWETHRGYTAANFALRLADAGLPTAALYVGKLIIDEVIQLSQHRHPDFQHLLVLVGVEFAIALLTGALGRMVGLIDALLGDLVANRTSVMLIRHAAKLDLQQFEDAEFYDKLERARRQTTSRTVLMSQVFSQVQDLVSMAFMLTGLAVFEPWLILLLIIAVIPAFLSETYFNRRSYSLARNWTPERRELDYLRFVGASDQTAKEVKLFGLADFLVEKFETLANTYYEANKRLATRRAAWGWLFNALGEAGYYAAYIFIVFQTVMGVLSIGSLTFLAGAFRQLRALLQRVLSRFSEIAQSALYLQDLFDFLEMKPAITSLPSAAAIPQPISSGFVFENVSFQYPGSDRYVLRNLSFTLQAGEKLALVGENGAGKTTITKLLSRLYEPTEGRILLDGRDLRTYSLEELHAAIGVIFQDFVRFQFSAGENIAIGEIVARQADARIRGAANRSLADAVIEGLPMQYQTPLGKRFKDGVELSGGQWQKIALARAYMRDAQVLILDEPTAALDARAEYEAFQRFIRLTEGKTAVIISHRFSTVRMADRILVLQHGSVHEIGSHEELLAQNGLYAELFNLQAEGYR